MSWRASGPITSNDAENTRVVLEMADRPLVGVRFFHGIGDRVSMKEEMSF
jgi:hypothetical protein